MKIEYQDEGEASRMMITSWLFDWQTHNRLVDEMLSRIPQLRAVDEGFFRRTTVLSGRTAHILCAEVIAEEYGFEVREVSHE
ncbi:TPA: hypothetical protein P5S08_004604 [Salmonella enterica subsp. enterica serovar Concord]|nr:hypothetical protein [Salmonella enterica subsp. enterica serovar Concord]